MKRLFLCTLLILMMVVVVQSKSVAAAFDDSPKKVDVDSEGTQYNDPLAQNLFGKDGPFSVSTSSPEAVADKKEQEQKEEEKPADTAEETAAPETVVVASTSVTVRSGDSLSSIARRVYGDASRYQEIIEANKDKYPSLVKNPDLIHPGWELIIPSEIKDAAQPDSNEAKTPEVSTDENSSSPAAEIVKVPNLSTIEKQVRIQKVIYAANKAIGTKGKRISSITPSVVKLLIEKGYMTKEEWMAMNPPVGYRWEVDNQGVVVLKSKNGKEVTPKQIEKIDKKAKKAEEKAEKEAKKAKEKAAKAKAKEDKKAKKAEDKAEKEAKKAEEKAAKAKAKEDKKAKKAKDKADKEAKKAEEKAAKAKAKKDKENKEAEEKAAIEKARIEADKVANTKYHKMLNDMGMPDLSANRRDYGKAISAGSKFLSKGFFRGVTSFNKFYNYSNYPDYNMVDLQEELKSAQLRYQKAVESKKTSKILGVFGDTIESTSKLVLKKQAKLQERWAELKKAIAESHDKAKSLKANVKTNKDKKVKLEKELAKLDAYEASNGSKIQDLNKSIKDIDEEIEDDNDKLESYNTLIKTFK